MDVDVDVDLDADLDTDADADTDVVFKDPAQNVEFVLMIQSSVQDKIYVCEKKVY